ncbi:MAG: ribokinase, partial [Woeseiaceae bacterium]|nr:ribokinase [Woeseiaceae bacterium]
MPRILVVGSVNLDFSARVHHLPAPGETVTEAELQRFPGGKGANQALAARRLGADVSLMACVGDDTTAYDALLLLREGGVDLACVQTHETLATGVALIAVDRQGENQIVVAPGANWALDVSQLQVPEADAVICQLEVPQAAIAEVASQFSGFLCANLAPARDIDDALFARANLVIVNETEAAFYGDRLQRCSGMVATTFGANGAELRQDGQVIARAIPPAVNAIDTVGAGDTFTAALVVALVEG